MLLCERQYQRLLLGQPQNRQSRRIGFPLVAIGLAAIVPFNVEMTTEFIQLALDRTDVAIPA